MSVIEIIRDAVTVVLSSIAIALALNTAKQARRAEAAAARSRQAREEIAALKRREHE